MRVQRFTDGDQTKTGFGTNVIYSVKYYTHDLSMACL